MRIRYLSFYDLSLALLSSCLSKQEESKAKDFLFASCRHYSYVETSLVGAGGNRIPFSPYQFANLYGALDILDGDDRGGIEVSKIQSDLEEMI